ncbi:MAG TPA: hypothetical protein VGQ35_20560 [Dongiaceae bacterium]|jgi:hypothetical protein|nr:hypothetical protein [Dongiaceae bacterium]
MSKSSRRRPEDDTPMPAGEVTAILGQVYVVILLAAIAGAATVNIGSLVNAMDVLQVGDPANASNFTA